MVSRFLPEKFLPKCYQGSRTLSTGSPFSADVRSSCICLDDFCRKTAYASAQFDNRSKIAVITGAAPMKNVAQKTPLPRMQTWSRRGFILSAGAGVTAACSGGTKNRARDRIDSNVQTAVQQMKLLHPFTVDLASKAAGMLMMPKIRKAGFGLGGSYGEGALLIGGATVDYYNLIAASFGFQAGVQQYSSVLFFMDSNVLRDFRERDGWTMGADLEFTLLDSGSGAAGIDNNTYPDEVYAIVFNQAGLLIGASLEGAKYSRVIR